MRRHPAPFILREVAGFLEQIDGHARFTDVVHQACKPELIELQLRHSETASERYGEDANVDAVRERVLVVVANGSKTDERSLFVQDLIDDPLHYALDLPHARRLSHSHRVDDVF